MRIGMCAINCCDESGNASRLAIGATNEQIRTRQLSDGRDSASFRAFGAGRSACSVSNNAGGWMAKEELLEFPGVVTELLPNATFRVKLENEHEIIAHTARPMPQKRKRGPAGGQSLVGR